MATGKQGEDRGATQYKDLRLIVFLAFFHPKYHRLLFSQHAQ